MAPGSPSSGSVLIVDADASIRRLIGTVLERDGFHTIGVDDLASVATMLEPATFAAIVRDLNLGPTERSRCLTELAATAPGLLRRTIITTTAPSRAETAIAPGTVFAIVSKPFDIEHLVKTVRACARASREADRREARRTAPSRQSRSERDTEGPVQLDSLRRFARSAPQLRHLLSGPVGGQREAALRAEMRRTLGALAATLTQAAQVEANRTRAAAFRTASTVATRFADVPAPVNANPARGRGH